MVFLEEPLSIGNSIRWIRLYFHGWRLNGWMAGYDGQFAANSTKITVRPFNVETLNE